MRTLVFRTQLRKEVETISQEEGWDFNNRKLRVMALENQCFELLNQSHNESDNRSEDSILRTDDFG